LEKKGYANFEIYVCNDGRAQFCGLVKSISYYHSDIWKTICEEEKNKIIYLGIGTGLGAGYGIIDYNGNFRLLDLKNAYDIIANNEKWEKIHLFRDDLFDMKLDLGFPYQYGDLISSKFFRKYMQTVDLCNLNTKAKEFHFIPRILSVEKQLNENTIKTLLESDNHSSPFNSLVINSILEKEIFTSKTEEIIEIGKRHYEAYLIKTLKEIEHELRKTLVKNIRHPLKYYDRKCDYETVIDKIIKIKTMGKCIHFIGIGKSHSIGRNLEYIYNNLGIRSASLELTGANSENLTPLDRGDLVFLISDSGETYELLNLVKYIHNKDCTIVALTGNMGSPLALHADYAINAKVTHNPSPIPEAPTTSTTTSLAAGTAIAMVVSYYFDYDKEIFLVDHPDLEFDFNRFEGVKADPSFDKLTKIEDIFITFANSVRSLNNRRFINEMFNVSKEILISHFNKRTIFLTGAGASLRVAEKISATMTSIGIDAVAVNPAQLPHGDFAHLKKGDLLIIISYSGETKQLIRVAKIANLKEVEIAVITSKRDSILANNAKRMLIIAGTNADDSKLVPIPDQKILSSFINLTVGDALAVMLAEIISATRDQFEKDAHPGGIIERKGGKYDDEDLIELNSLVTIESICNRDNDKFREVEYVKKREHFIRIMKIHLEILEMKKNINHNNWLLKEFNSYRESIITKQRNEIILFGMGSIGLAYLGNILTECGKNIIFIERDENKVNELKGSNCSYQLQFCEETCKNETKSIKGVSVFKNTEIADIAALALRINTIFVAVGINNLDSLISTIAYITMRRYAYRIYTPLNVVFNENFPLVKNPLDEFNHKVLEYIDEPYIKSYFNEYIGIVPAIDEAVVPNIENLSNPIKVEANFSSLFIDKTKWKSNHNDPIFEFNNSKHIIFSDNFYPLHMRKLWIHNMAHSLIGFLGYFHGHVRIVDALNDTKVLKIAEKAIDDIATEVYRRWKYDDYKTKEEYIKWRIKQYMNSNLNDTIDRVCRDPIRKLKKYDRLIGPLNYIWKYRDPTNNNSASILIGIIAAMEYAKEKKLYDSYDNAKKEIEKIIDVDSKYLYKAEEEFQKFKEDK
jgi:D-arabinose 5-phosphate isomerase GutQ/mannitol-1-phosphate/altronate dehydrogenase